MSHTDPIADMLTRVRNGLMVEKSEVAVPNSKIKIEIVKLLKDEGYIIDYDRIDDGNQGLIRVTLKYTAVGSPVISEIKRVSKPGCRVYSEVKELPKVLGGLGITVVSTSKGVMSDRVCRRENVCGELICMVS